jgi:hypothetical protein
VIRFVVWLLLLAAVLYAVFWAIDRRNWSGGQGGGPGGSRRPSAPPPRPRGPLGPDDDEAFLRDLERRRRREHGDPPPG